MTFEKVQAQLLHIVSICDFNLNNKKRFCKKRSIVFLRTHRTLRNSYLEYIRQKILILITRNVRNLKTVHYIAMSMGQMMKSTLLRCSVTSPVMHFMLHVSYAWRGQGV